MVGLHCYKSDKDRERFVTISDGLKFLETVPDGLSSDVNVIILLGISLFFVQDVCTMT